MPIFNYKLNKLNDSVEESREKLKEFLTSQGIEVQESYTLRKLIRIIPTKIIRPSNLNNNLYGHSMINLGGNNVLLTGGAIDSQTVTSDNYLLNIATNIRVNKLQLDTPRQKHSVVTYYGTNIMISGGLTGGVTGDRITKNQVYNIDTNTYILKVDLLSSRERFTSNYSNNVVYMLGGVTGNGWGSVDNFHYAYNVSTNSYTSKVAIGNYAGQATVNKNGYYYFGGQENQYSEVRNWVKYYNRDNDTFRSKQGLSASRSTLTAIELKNGTVLLSGGYKINNAKSRKNEIYNISSNTYTNKRDLNPPRSDHGCVYLGDGGIFVGGKLTKNDDEVTGNPTNIVSFYNYKTDVFYSESEECRYV